jgi:hypothetical protein
MMAMARNAVAFADAQDQVRSGALAFEVLSAAPADRGRMLYTIAVPVPARKRHMFRGGVVSDSKFGTAVVRELERFAQGVTVTLIDMAPNVVQLMVDPSTVRGEAPTGPSAMKVLGLTLNVCIHLQEVINAHRRRTLREVLNRL